MRIQMKINNNDKTNFQAKLFVNAKIPDNEINSILQVYKLTKFDKPFIQRCLDVCQGKDRFIPSCERNIGVNSNPKDGLKNFLRAFLFDRKGNYYIAIRDNKIISGVLRMYAQESFESKSVITSPLKNFVQTIKSFSKTYFPMIRIILNNQQPEQIALTKAAVKDLKSELSSWSNSLNNTNEAKIRPDYVYLTTNIDKKKFIQYLFFDKNGYYYTPSRCNSSCAQIESFLERKTPQASYDSKFSDKTEYDLAKVLDID